MVQLHTQKCLSVGHPELKKKKRKQALRRIDNTSAFITHHGYRAQTLNYSLKFLQTSLQLSILQVPAVCKSRSNTDLKKQHWSHIFFWQFLKVNSWSKNALLYMTGQYSLLHSKLDISIFWQSNTLHCSWKHISSFKGISVDYQTQLYQCDQLLHKQEVQIGFKNQWPFSTSAFIKRPLYTHFILYLIHFWHM